MSGYKLHYFDGRGNGEIVRLALAEFGIKYEDIRHSGESWATMKAACEFKFMPQLVTPDGQILVQSLSIVRFLASENGLPTPTGQALYQSECVIDQTKEIADKIMLTWLTTPDEEKAEVFKKFFEEKMDSLVAPITSILEKTKSGYVGGNKMTLGDLGLVRLVDMFKQSEGMAWLTDAYPKLGAHYDHMMKAHPKLANYIAGRKKTDF